MTDKKVGSCLPGAGREEDTFVTHSWCPTLWDTRDCSPPGSFVHGILQARILEWAAIPFSRGSSWPRDWTWVSHITARDFFTVWTSREDPGEERLLLHVYHFLLQDEKVLKFCCVIVWIYIALLNCILKMVKMINLMLCTAFPLFKNEAPLE